MSYFKSTHAVFKQIQIYLKLYKKEYQEIDKLWLEGTVMLEAFKG